MRHTAPVMSGKGGAMASDKGGHARGHERFDDIMRTGIDSHRWVMQNLYEKAKHVLTAGTIVLGIVMGGLGTAGGLSGGAVSAGWELLAEQNRPVATVIVVVVSVSLVAIFAAVVLAVMAMRVSRVKSFGRTEPFMRGGKVDYEAVDQWVFADDESMYRRTHKAYIDELRSLEAQNKRVGRYTAWSQIALCVGLSFSVTGAIAFLAFVALS